MTNRSISILFSLALLVPAITYSNPFSNLFKNPKDVASKVAELPEQYPLNVHGLDFSQDGKQLAVVSTDEKINIWDWRSGRIVRTLEKARGATDGQVTEPIRYSPDGHLLVACHSRAADDIVARIWDTESWAIVHDITDPVGGGGCAIGFTPDGKSLIRVFDRIVTKPGDNLIIYDTTSWQPMWGLRTVPFYPKALSISPDGKFVAIGGAVIDGGPETQKIIIVDLEQRTIVRTIPNTVGFDFGQLAWSPNGANLAAIGQRGWDGTANDGHGAYTSGLDTVMVFDAHTGKQIAGDQLEDIAGTSLRYTPDGKYLIEGVMNGRGSGLGVRIWDGQHRELLQEIPGEVSGLAVSRDGHYFAMGEVKKTVIWQLK